MKKTTSVTKTKLVKQLSIGKYSILDTQPFAPLYFSDASVKQISKLTGLGKRWSSKLAKFRKQHKQKPLHEIPFHLFADENNSERLKRCLLFANDKRTVITNVEATEGRIMSDKKFFLRVSFVGNVANGPLLISIQIQWTGKPFVIEKVIARDRVKVGYADIAFDSDQTLPVGPATFHVALYNVKGGQSCFRTTYYVLPSNPFSLNLSPNVNFVTGTFSLRAVKQGNNYSTSLHATLSNGNSFAVNMNHSFTWKFWDGGVGGSLIENGTGSFGGTIQVPAFGTWGGWINFSSPPGSGIYNKFNSREDLTLEIIMNKSDGTAVSGTITARTMFRFGVNLTKVSPRDFVGQENVDLQNAILVTRAIYERTDVSFDFDNRFIPDSQVGGFEMINTFDEVRDLWEQWSGPNTNNNIDAFIAQISIPTSTGTADGVDGDIPGPTSHSGRSSGVVANKAGFIDTSGRPRLNVNYLGMLIGHELGHYLGLPHITSPNNLMLWNSGTNDTSITYDQYKILIRHGWVSIS